MTINIFDNNIKYKILTILVLLGIHLTHRKRKSSYRLAGPASIVLLLSFIALYEK